jgi:hypothetical protein
VVVVSASYAERVPFPDTPSPRFWRGPVRIYLAAWGGALAGFGPGIALDLPIAAGIAIGLGVAGLVLALPQAPSRHADLEISVADGELTLVQGRRTHRVPLADVRRAGVRTAADAARRPTGYGAVFGRGLRWTFDIPDPSLGLVRIDRGRGGLDLDIVSARPDELVGALQGESAR